MAEVKCPQCGGTRVVKNGSKTYKDGLRQKLQCKSCGASIKGDILEPLPKGRKMPDIEIRADEPKEKPDLKKFMKEL